MKPRVAVLGLGVMGAMSLLALAERDVECVGFEMLSPGHPHGASGGGGTRIFRSTASGVRDVERDVLLERSRAVWTALRRDGRSPVFDPCGALTVLPGDSPEVARVCQSAPPGVEVLSARQVERRWPQHRLRPRDVGLFDRAGGLLRAQDGVLSALQEARARGARVREASRGRVRERHDGVLEVTTSAGTEAFDGLVVATGAWPVGPEWPFGSGEVTRRSVVLSWFATTDVAGFGSAAFPPGRRHDGATGQRLSFFPKVDGSGVKINVMAGKRCVPDVDCHHPPIDIDHVDRWLLRVAELFQGLAPRPHRLESYVEGYTRDGDGLIARFGTRGRGVALGGFSGEGYKYAPALGEIAAELASSGRSDRGFAAFQHPRRQAAPVPSCG